MKTGTSVARELVLVGGGHSHVQVLRSLLMAPLPGVRTTVVVDRPVSVYSGMFPGFVAGDYTRDQLEIDVVPLAKRAGCRVILAAATRVDAVAKCVHVQGRPAVRYDLASVNLGSTVAGLDTPGVRAFAMPTRPIGALATRIDALVARLDGAKRCHIAVVGGGAGGVELAFALHARLHREGVTPEVTLVDSGAEILRGSAVQAVARVRLAAAERGIAVMSGRRVAEVAEDHLRFTEGEDLATDVVIWVTGAVAHDVLAKSGLPVDQRGFVRVGDDLRVVGQEDLFAVGDCAVPESRPDLPRAGVYAVRMGPVLHDNLRAHLAGRPLKPYVPQSDFLSLLNLGDGTAIGSKWGVAFEGQWVYRWKDRIDLAFMEKFQVLDPTGALTPAFPPMADDDMRCAGCAAKVGPLTLARALEEGGVAAGGDDAALVQLGRATVAWTVDAFPAFCDDAWFVARVAAVHALCDLWVRGVRPHSALAVLTLPEDAPAVVRDTLDQVLAGLRDVLDAHGVALVGGHTALGDTLTIGLTALGDGEKAVGLSGGQVGDVLVLTGALGTGVALRAHMRGGLPGLAWRAVAEAMARSEAAVLDVAHHLHAATDVSGFGLANHLLDLCVASSCGAELVLDDLPVLPGVAACLARGVRSTAHPANHEAAADRVSGDDSAARFDLLFDPQTGGGCVLAVAPEHAAAVAESVGGVVVGALIAGSPRVVVR